VWLRRVTRDRQEDVVERWTPDSEVVKCNAVFFQRAPSCDQHAGAILYREQHLIQGWIGTRSPTTEVRDQRDRPI
jgi:hypothetical protein